MMPGITETELIAEKIKSEKSISDLAFFAAEIMAWQGSDKRAAMLTGKSYYEGGHSILARKRTVIGKAGQMEEVANLPNNHIVDNRYARLVDQKKNYLLGRPLTFRSEDTAYAVALRAVLGRKFLRTLKLAGEEAIKGGISWLYPYVNEMGELRFRLFPSYEICPFWQDAAHTELDCAARVYTAEIYRGKEKETLTLVDLFEAEGIRSFELKGTELIPRGLSVPYLSDGENGYAWGGVPLIAMKYNALEIPLISRVRQLQDALNLILSDFVNNMEENVHNTILVLKNYDGTDLGEFRRNLATYGAVKTRTMEGASGGVDTLKVEVNAENYRVVLDILRKAITENARGFDGRDERMSGTPNQLNIRSMYSDIDLDANDMETELQAAFEEVFGFVNRYLAAVQGKNFSEATAEVIFNRDILINESEAIDNCVKSEALLSKESLLAQHPWVTNLDKEMKKVEE